MGFQDIKGGAVLANGSNHQDIDGDWFYNGDSTWTVGVLSGRSHIASAEEIANAQKANLVFIGAPGTANEGLYWNGGSWAGTPTGANGQPGTYIAGTGYVPGTQIAKLRAAGLNNPGQLGSMSRGGDGLTLTLEDAIPLVQRILADIAQGLEAFWPLNDPPDVVYPNNVLDASGALVAKAGDPLPPHLLNKNLMTWMAQNAVRDRRVKQVNAINDVGTDLISAAIKKHLIRR